MTIFRALEVAQNMQIAITIIDPLKIAIGIKFRYT